jgi:hypothetical protein
MTEAELVRLRQVVFGMGLSEAFSGKNALVKSFLKLLAKDAESDWIGLCSRYLGFGKYTYPGLYEDFFRSLPSEVKVLCELVSSQLLVLNSGNVAGFEMDKPLSYLLLGNTDNVVFDSAASMVAELFRREPLGFVGNRPVLRRLVSSSRNSSVLLASILKSMFFPARVRVGFVGGNKNALILGGNWFVEYLDVKGGEWKAIDLSRWSVVDEDKNRFEVGHEFIGSAASAWLGLRRKEFDPDRLSFCGICGAEAVLKMLIFDYSAVMGEEVPERFVHPLMMNDMINVDSVRSLDNVAKLMLDVDRNVSELQKIWDTDNYLKGENSFVVNL